MYDGCKNLHSEVLKSHFYAFTKEQWASVDFRAISILYRVEKLNSARLPMGWALFGRVWLQWTLLVFTTIRNFDHIVKIDLNCEKILKWFLVWGKMHWQFVNFQSYRESFVCWIESVLIFVMVTFRVGSNIILKLSWLTDYPSPTWMLKELCNHLLHLKFASASS